MILGPIIEPTDVSTLATEATLQAIKDTDGIKKIVDVVRSHLVEADGTDLVLSSGGSTGIKVMVVGDSDKHVRGVVAAGSSLTGIEPVLFGVSDASGNAQPLKGDTTNGAYVQVKNTPAVTMADGGSSTLGAKADNRSTATDTTAVTAMQVLKEISYMEQNPASRAVTNAGTFPVQTTPATSGGLLIKNCTSGDGSTALTNSAQAIKASAGQLFGWYIFNPNTVTAWVIIYNTAAASVTVGTTNPAMVLGVPAGSAANVLGETGIEFSNTGWSAAAVMTSAAGNTAPTTALDALFFYK